ncbi:Reverse transcriptase zinc-binding domain [Sesbania bispinosa]|nr:Reverse transcriptase zinc-binding domain [Sesbania bispinosa]
MSSADGSWLFDSFSSWLPNHVVAEISANLAARDDLGQDHLVWKFSHDGNFSTSSAYASIHDFPSVDESKWKLLWHWEGLVRAKYFLWLVVKGGLKTNCFRWDHGMSDSSLFPLCGAHIETYGHILSECEKVSKVWDSVFSGFPVLRAPGTSVVSWLFTNISNDKMHCSGASWSLFFGVTCWHIWRARNGVIFNHEAWDHNSISHRIWNTVRGFVVASKSPLSASRLATRRVTKMITWSPPSEDWLKWNLDGSVINCSSCASSGGVLRDSSAKWITRVV